MGKQGGTITVRIRQNVSERHVASTNTYNDNGTIDKTTTIFSFTGQVFKTRSFLIRD